MAALSVDALPKRTLFPCVDVTLLPSTYVFACATLFLTPKAPESMPETELLLPIPTPPRAVIVLPEPSATAFAAQH